jgi:hypothetical protein
MARAIMKKILKAKDYDDYVLCQLSIDIIYEFLNKQQRNELTTVLGMRFAYHNALQKGEIVPCLSDYDQSSL